MTAFINWLTENQAITSIFADFFSAISIIIASVAAVLITGSKERRDSKKVAQYYNSLVRVIWVELKVFHYDLEKYQKDQDISNILVQASEIGSLCRCRNYVEKIRSNMLAFVQNSEPDSIDLIHSFFSSFDILQKLIEINKAKNSSDILNDILKITKQASEDMYEVMKIQYNLNTWYAKKFLNVDERLNRIS
ncbi:hypothetical protein [uncultured Sphaerochaeta sp.]|uniref:hypothetical protein n=1 Tax=uncultured Sphaerochaeta sp. TaxID=886478 RepID=UPI0029CA0188|nr:hypothetical protein [uncultured Sphaerochaeta sp.]